jgi:hypothetical protein
MTLTLNLTPETETRLRQQAELLGQDVSEFVLQAVSEKLADADQSRPIDDIDEWTRKLHAVIARHPKVTHFIDDSRESIYAGRGE